MGKKEYWEERYASGGTSGQGSIGASREWKWKVINSFFPKINHVIDVGCGDLSFWEGRDCEDYLGIDISETVIKENREKRPEWSFIISKAETHVEGLKSECVFCFEILFHIMSDEVFTAILENLCRYSTKYIIIHTWIRNPFTIRNQVKKILLATARGRIKWGLTTLARSISTPYTDGRYQYFRPLEQFIYIFKECGFTLIEKRENPIDNIGAIYLFKK
jgi:hypothetical protein